MSDNVYIYSYIFILGAVLGSFLNLVILRVPKNISIITPSSHCSFCKHKLKFYENIPLLSFIFLRAKCKSCKKHISWQYFFVELLCAFGLVLLYKQSALNWHFLALVIYFSLLLVLSFIDLKYKAIPSVLLFFCLVSAIFIPSNFSYALKNALLFTGGIYLINYFLSFYIQNIKARFLKNSELLKQEALGSGDIPIVTSIGLIFSLKAGLSAIFLAAIFALIPALINSFYKKSIETAFVPFLALGIFCEYVFGISGFGVLK